MSRAVGWREAPAKACSCVRRPKRAAGVFVALTKSGVQKAASGFVAAVTNDPPKHVGPGLTDAGGAAMDRAIDLLYPAGYPHADVQKAQLVGSFEAQYIMKVRRMCLRTNIPEENSLLGSPGRAEEEGRCFEGEPGTNVQKCYRYKFTVEMVTPDGFDGFTERVQKSFFERVASLAQSLPAMQMGDWQGHTWLEYLRGVTMKLETYSGTSGKAHTKHLDDLTWKDVKLRTGSEEDARAALHRMQAKSVSGDGGGGTIAYTAAEQEEVRGNTLLWGTLVRVRGGRR